MQPLDPQQPSDSGQTPQPPQVPQSPYGAPQAPYNAPQPPQSPYSGQQQPPYGGPQQMGGAPAQIPGAEKKLPAGLCGILLNGLGVHKFILGYNTEGIIMLVAFFGGFFLCGIPSLAAVAVGFIEGIIYLTKTDEQFVREYITGKKPWF